MVDILDNWSFEILSQTEDPNFGEYVRYFVKYYIDEDDNEFMDANLLPYYFAFLGGFEIDENLNIYTYSRSEALWKYIAQQCRKYLKDEESFDLSFLRQTFDDDYQNIFRNLEAAKYDSTAEDIYEEYY